MTRTEARAAIEKFIRDERSWRFRVFVDKAKIRERKIAECDRALAALDVLEPPVAKPAEQLPPRTLFDVED